MKEEITLVDIVVNLFKPDQIPCEAAAILGAIKLEMMSGLYKAD